jgi:HEAT repeat protein
MLRSTQIQTVAQHDISGYLQQLRDPDEHVRSDSVLQLGRLKIVSAVDPVAATLAGDRSALVREAAARSLGLMGSPKALPALQHAALADPDRDVRHSAQFAVDVIQSGR